MGIPFFLSLCGALLCAGRAVVTAWSSRTDKYEDPASRVGLMAPEHTEALDDNPPVSKTPFMEQAADELDLLIDDILSGKQAAASAATTVSLARPHAHPTPQACPTQAPGRVQRPLDEGTQQVLARYRSQRALSASEHDEKLWEKMYQGTQRAHPESATAGMRSDVLQAAAAGSCGRARPFELAPDAAAAAVAALQDSAAPCAPAVHHLIKKFEVSCVHSPLTGSYRPPTAVDRSPTAADCLRLVDSVLNQGVGLLQPPRLIAAATHGNTSLRPSYL